MLRSISIPSSSAAFVFVRLLIAVGRKEVMRLGYTPALHELSGGGPKVKSKYYNRLQKKLNAEIEERGEKREEKRAASLQSGVGTEIGPTHENA